MAAMSRLLPLVAYSTFAVFLLALLATPTNAIANEPYGHAARGHGSIAKRKRNVVKRAKRCRPQSVSLAPASTSAAGASYNAPAPTSSVYGAAPTTKAADTTKPASTKPATTRSSSSAVATTSAYTAPSTGGGGANLDPAKKLIWAWPNGPTDLPKWTGPRVGGLYTWSPSIPSNAASVGIPGFPMLWGFNQEDSFAKINAGNYKLCFGMNEPNQEGQSDMSPQDGATLWKAKVEPMRALGCKLVSPATTSAPSGKQWIKDWLAACNGGCTVDYISLHWYDVSIEAFKAYVTDFHTTFGKPIIVSEYACQNFNGGAQCTKDETWALHQTMAKWFDETDWVVGYAPFGAMREMQGVNEFNQLMNTDGSMNALGEWYANH